MTSPLIPKMLIISLAISFDHFWFTLIHGPNIPGFYIILLFRTSFFTFTSRHLQNCVLFLLWLSIFVPSGAISVFFSISILGTYWPEEFIFQCHIFLPFHTVNGALKARMLKWFSIAFFSGPLKFCQNSPQWPVHLGWPYMAHLIVSLN